MIGNGTKLFHRSHKIFNKPEIIAKENFKGLSIQCEKYTKHVWKMKVIEGLRERLFNENLFYCITSTNNS